MNASGKIGRRHFVASTLAAAASPLVADASPKSLEHERPAIQTGDRPSQEMRSFRLAAVSMTSQPVAPAQNLERTADWVGRAANAGAKLACFPELSLTGYATTRTIWEAAEPVPGPSTHQLEKIARATRMIIGAGLAEKKRGIVYNTYVFVGPDGLIGKSRKIHIPVAEVGYWRGGGVPPVIDIGPAKVGVNICFDNLLPESSRLVALQGAQLIVSPFAWAVGPWGHQPNHTERNRAWKDYIQRTLPARAIDNGVFLVATNAVGTLPTGQETYHGNPVVLVYNPQGQLIDESPDEASDELMVVTDLDHRVLVDRRSETHFHPRFRRPELYGLLASGDIGP